MASKLFITFKKIFLILRWYFWNILCTIVFLWFHITFTISVWKQKERKVLVTHLCPALCDPMDDGPPGSFIHRILQARILEWVAIPFSKGSSWPRDQIWVSCVAGRLFTVWDFELYVGEEDEVIISLYYFFRFVYSDNTKFAICWIIIFSPINL